MMRTWARQLVEHESQLDDDELVHDFAREWESEPNRGYGMGLERLETRPQLRQLTDGLLDLHSAV